jgi:hypothetical protein
MSHLYAGARQAFLDGDLSWRRDTFSLVYVRTGPGHYKADLLRDRALRAIAAADRVAMSPPLTHKTSDDGVAGADNVTTPEVIGPKADAIVIIKSEPAAMEESQLVAYLDDGAGLPLLPNGGDVLQVWDTGPNKIFKL